MHRSGHRSCPHIRVSYATLYEHPPGLKIIMQGIPRLGLALRQHWQIMSSTNLHQMTLDLIFVLQASFSCQCLLAKGPSGLKSHHDEMRILPMQELDLQLLACISADQRASFPAVSPHKERSLIHRQTRFAGKAQAILEKINRLH